MKKFTLILLVIISLVGCTKEELLIKNEPKVILKDNCCYKKINNEILFNGQKMPGVDINSFQYLEETNNGPHIYFVYAADQNKVFLNGLELKLADPSTFKALNYGYSKDNNRVYFEQNVIEVANPNSFKLNESRNPIDAEDERYLYHEGEVIKAISDKEIIILDSYYSKNLSDVFYMRQKIQGADATTFNLISDYDGFAVDKNIAYYQNQAILNSDPNTFEVVPYIGPYFNQQFYSKDKKTAYYKASAIQGSDASSFEVIDIELAKDKTGSYSKDIRIDEAMEGRDIICGKYAKDEDLIYYKNNELKDAHHSTFRCLSQFKDLGEESELAIDKNYIYSKGEIYTDNPNKK